VEPVKANAPRLLALALVAAGFFALAGLAWHQMAILGDGFWTIATGRWLIAHRSLPSSDPFAFGSMPGSWVIVSSGACALFALVTDHFGPRGLMVFAAGVEALAVWLLWTRTARTAASRVMLLPLALFFVQVDAADLSARGQIFGDLGLVLLLFLLARLRDGARVRGSLALVLPLVAVWANLHLSFVIALVLPIAAAGMAALEPRASRPALWPFLAASCVALVGACLNPYGPVYLRLALGTALDPSTQRLDLFQSPGFHEPSWLVAPVLGVVLVIARGRWGGDRMRLPEQTLVLLFLVAACTSRRFATSLVAVEMAIAGPLLDTFDLPRARIAAHMPRLVAGASAFATAIGTWWIAHGNDPLGDVPVAAALVARDAARARVASHQTFVNVVEPLHWGGYFAYAWMGEPRYFIDGRDHLKLFGNGAFDDDRTLSQGDPGALEVLDVYEAGVVVWPHGWRIDALLRASPSWRLAYADAIAEVYVRVPARRPRRYS
jgi:hypothetical protein